MLDTKPNFVSVEFEPYCMNCKHPEPHVIDNCDDLFGRPRIRVYCENMKKCKMLYEFLLDKIQDESKEVQE